MVEVTAGAAAPAFATHPLYLDEVQQAAAAPVDWSRLQGAQVVVAGASGMIGSFLVDVLMHRNRQAGLGCTVHALARDLPRAQARFAAHAGQPGLHLVAADIAQPLALALPRVDVVFQGASTTHPLAYAQDPVGTVMTNVQGTCHLLQLAARTPGSRFLMASSVEVYGENRGDVERFDEGYCGHIDCNTLRAGYPESKRAAEALCQAFARQHGQDVVVARLARSYGPSLLPGDSKALSQFIGNALGGQDIVLKSAGRQQFSYTHVADAVTGLLHLLGAGAPGAAYNIAHPSSDTTLADLAALVAAHAGTRVVFDLPADVERAGQSPVTRALMDGRRLQALGWAPRFDLRTGLARTLDILRGARRA